MNPQGKTEENLAQYAKELQDLGRVSVEKIVQIAMDVGEYLSPKGINLKLNQIRRFLDESRQIELDVKKGIFQGDRVYLLLPKLAYAAGRESKVKSLMIILEPAIRSASKSKDNFMKFLRLIESIVAYHRYFGGQN